MKFRILFSGFALLALTSSLVACNKHVEEVVSSADGEENVVVNSKKLSSWTSGEIEHESDEIVELGQALYFDKLLSGNKDISCATCHHPLAATGDQLPVAIGAAGDGFGFQRQLKDGNLIVRTSTNLFNVGHPSFNVMLWDGGVQMDLETGELITFINDLNGPFPTLSKVTQQLTSALAAQALVPLTSFAEMRGVAGSNELSNPNLSDAEIWEKVIDRLVGWEGIKDKRVTPSMKRYREIFLKAYPRLDSWEEINIGHAGRALAGFQRKAFEAMDSPFDRFVKGDSSALTQSQKKGLNLFMGKAKCSQCHSGPLFTDQKFYALAFPQVGPGFSNGIDDLGLYHTTEVNEDKYKFRTPSLRNVTLTAPYTHSGAYKDLESVILHHADPVNSLKNYDPKVHISRELFRAKHDDEPSRNRARANAIPKKWLKPFKLSDAEMTNLLDFLESLTDPSSINLEEFIPETVPSGLPVGE